MTLFEGRKAIGSQGYWFNTQRRTLWVLDTILWRKVPLEAGKGTHAMNYSAVFSETPADSPTKPTINHISTPPSFLLFLGLE
ncbi:hypothetical protein V1478_018609 [Vespula squamosa]